MRRYVAVKPTNKAGVPSWRSQWSEASHPRGNRAVPHVPDSVPDFARPRDESVTAAGRLADLLTSCAAARPKGGAGCVSAHVRICPGPPGKPGGYRDDALGGNYDRQRLSPLLYKACPYSAACAA